MLSERRRDDSESGSAFPATPIGGVWSNGGLGRNLGLAAFLFLFFLCLFACKGE